MTRPSGPQLRLLHAVRVLGFADSAVVAHHAGISLDNADQLLNDAKSQGWVQHFAFADLGGWSLTETGKAESQRQLAAERADADPENVVAAVYRDFLPLNARLLRAVTDWQIKPTSEDRLAPNLHTDPNWDARILDELAALSAELAPIAGRLSGVLARFGGYASRFESAVRKARSGEVNWVDKTDVDSCHRVWFQLHEDLIATLGIDRHTEGISDTG